jgi:MFS family permease
MNIRSLFSPLKGNLLVLVISMIIWTFTYQMIQTYETLYIFALGGTGAVLSLLSAVQTLLCILFRVPGGYLADVYNRRMIVGLLPIITSFGYLFYIFAADWLWILFGVMILSLTCLYEPALMAIRTDSVQPAERGRGFVLFNTVPQIPAIIAPTLAGLIILDNNVEGGIQLSGVKVVYILALVGMVLAGFIRLFFLQDRDSSSVRKGFHVNVFREVYDTVKFCEPSLRKLIFLNGFFMFCFHFEGRFRTLYAVNVSGFSTLEWGVISSISQMASMIFILFIGWLIDHIGRKKVFVPAISFLGVAAFLFPFANSFLAILVIMIIVAICLKSRMMALQVLIADSIPPSMRGRIFSVVNISSSLGSSTSLILSGFLYDLNPKFPFYIASVMYCLAALIAIKFLRDVIY